MKRPEVRIYIMVSVFELPSC